MEERFAEYRQELVRRLSNRLGNAKSSSELSFNDFMERKDFTFKIFLPIVFGSLSVLSRLRDAEKLLLPAIVCVAWFAMVALAAVEWSNMKERIANRVFWLYEYDEIILKEIREDAKRERTAILNEFFSTYPRHREEMREYRERLRESEDFFNYCERHIDEFNIPVR